MKRSFTGIVLLVLLAVAASFIFMVPPSRQSRYGVSFVQQGYQTNATGEVIPIFAVSNSAPREVLVTAGRQIGPNVFDMLGSRPLTLAPGQTASVPVPFSSMSTQARAFLHCQPVTHPGWAGQVDRLLSYYVFKQKRVENVYAEEITR